MKRYIALLFGAVLLAPPADAADSTVSSMTGASALDGTELYYCVQSGADRKCTGDQIKTLANTSAVRATTTTSEALANSDQGKLVTFSNASAVACTIAQAGSGGNFSAGWVASLKNLGAGTVTCTPTTSTVDGAASFTLTQGQGVDLYSDGTNYFTQPGKGSGPGGSSGQIQTNSGSGGFSGISTISSSQLPSGTTHPGYKASVWYLPSGPFVTPAAGAAPAVTTAYCGPGFIGGNSAATISALGIRITTLGSSNIQLAIYNNDTTVSPNRPGTLVGNTGNIVNTSTGAVSASLGASASINPGWYWFCLQTNDTTVRYLAHLNSTDTLMPIFIGSSTLGNVVASGSSNTTGGVSTTTGISAFGTWPSNMNGSSWTEIGSTSPSIAFQFSSVP